MLSSGQGLLIMFSLWALFIALFASIGMRKHQERDYLCVAKEFARQANKRRLKKAYRL